MWEARAIWKNPRECLKKNSEYYLPELQAGIWIVAPLDKRQAKRIAYEAFQERFGWQRKDMKVISLEILPQRNFEVNPNQQQLLAVYADNDSIPYEKIRDRAKEVRIFRRAK